MKRATFGAVLLAAALGVSACGSSGGGQSNGYIEYDFNLPNGFAHVGVVGHVSGKCQNAVNAYNHLISSAPDTLSVNSMPQWEAMSDACRWPGQVQP